MRYLIFLVTLVFFSSCNLSDPEVDQVEESSLKLLKDKDHKVEICHKNAEDSYNKIEIAKSALDAHLAHGDGYPGGEVPGMEGYIFTEDCDCEESSPPTLESPVNGATDQILTSSLNWSNTTYATSYGLQISTDEEFSALVVDESGLDNSEFTILAGVLLENTMYYWRANASSNGFTSVWSDIWNFTTVPPQGSCPSTVTWGDQTYETVLIEYENYSRCWFKENLNIGTQIQGDMNPYQEGVIEKYCYQNNPDNCLTHGGLYSWEETMNYDFQEKTQGICPTGWHIPSDAEFRALTAAVGWGCSLTFPENQSGFSLLFGGSLQLPAHNNWNALDGNTFLWSSTEVVEEDAVWSLFMHRGSCNYYHWLGGKGAAVSVRCIKDE